MLLQVNVVPLWDIITILLQVNVAALNLEACIETVLACHILFFPEGFPPDGTPLTILLTYHTALVVLYYLLALFGTTLSAVLFIFNFVFRKAK